MKESTDYTIFRSIDGNRKINRGHVLRLSEAIERKNLLRYFPILLNEDMEVIDGQHRLTAAMKLELPVYYEIVDGLTLTDVMSINTHSKSWSINDFIDSHIELGKKDYAVLKEFMDRYNLGATIAGGLLSGFAKFKGGSNTTSIKKGDFTVSNYEQAERIAEQLRSLSKYCDNFPPSRDRELILALLRLDRNKQFDFGRLISKMKVHSLKLEKRPSDKYYLILLEEIYNFNSSANKVELYASTLSKTMKD